MQDLESLKAKCFRLQWSVDDIDWDAPGRELVTGEQAGILRDLMIDVYWIEFIAATVFEAMECQTRESTLRSIFASFAVDELRHANAELALMRRWGMLAAHERPTPNPSARRLLDSLEGSAHRTHPSVFAAIIPMTELVLDGALVRSLMQLVADPLCQQVFEKINADEARHLAVDFHILEKYGAESSLIANGMHLLRSLGRPDALYGLLLGYVPILSRSRRSMLKAGVDLDDVRRSLRRYVELGVRTPAIARHPTYRLMRWYANELANGRYQMGDLLLRLSD